MQIRKPYVVIFGLFALGVVGVLVLVFAFLGIRYLSMTRREAAHPSIQITSPGLNEIANVQSAIRAQAVAYARGESVTLLRFYADGFLAGEQRGPSENLIGTWNWAPPTEGIHTLSFLAYNQKGDANMASIKITAIPVADSDADGVADTQDSCPDQTGPAASHGCLLVDDRDQDGLPDTQDICPDQAGKPEDQGCPAASVPDRDRDGVPDAMDRCPDQVGLPEWEGCPAGAWVTDGDGDGVPDFLDTCPEQAGPPERGGCPVTLPQDSDGDGVIDEVDACKDQPGPSDNAGCPVTEDRDGDGVSDVLDDCPDVAGLEGFHGCLPEGWDTDTDGDGVMDFLDRCDAQPGPLINLGCPLPEDRDGDGIPDAEDNCPDLEGPADDDGCPSIPFPGTSLMLQRVLLPELLLPELLPLMNFQRFLLPELLPLCELHPETCDLDSDGLVGGDDDCPEEAGPRERRGCPAFPQDQDGDGVMDEADECISEAGEPADRGCPDIKDQDGDGVISDYDACPDRAGPPENSGCPRPGEETDVELDILRLYADPIWDGVYCYAKLTGITDMLRLPESGLLESSGGGSWDLGDRSNVTLSLTEDGSGTVEILCWGQPEDRSLFPQSLGTIVRTHGYEAWDNQHRLARAEGEGGWFGIVYRMCRGSCP